MKSPARAKITRSTGLAAMYRPPARIASPTCSRGSASAARVECQVMSTASTAANEAALTRKTVPELVAASSAPPMAGPMALARFWFTEPSEMAWTRSAGLTSSGCRVCQVGEVSACPVPTANTSASRTQGVTSPAMASAPRAVAATSMNVCVASRKRRRSTRSPTVPATIANSTTGRPAAVWTSAT